MDKQIIARVTATIVVLSIAATLAYFAGMAMKDSILGEYEDDIAFLKPYKENLALRTKR